ncbi:MAG: helix-turn-helix transcriptional regulator [Ilumatobacteraceae bacterium]
MTFASPIAEADDAAIDEAQQHLALALVSYMSGHVTRTRVEAEAVLAEPGLPASLYAAAEQSRLLAQLADGSMSTIAGAAAPSALLALAALAWRDGNVDKTLELLRAEMSTTPAGPAEGFYPGLGICTVYAALGQFDAAQAFVSRAADQISFGADPLWAAAPAMFAARVELASGQLDAANAAATAGVDIADDLGTSVLAPIGHDVLVWVALLRGDLDQATRAHGRWRTQALTIRLPFGNPNRQWAELRMRAVRGAPILGTPACDSAFDLVASDHSLFLEQPAAAAWLARAAHHAGDHHRANAIVTTAEHLAATNPHYPTVTATANHARGVITGDPDRLAAAADTHLSPWARASAAEDTAAVRSQRGDRSAARSWLERAADGYRRCGADRDHARTRARLRDIGVRSAHWSRQQRPVYGWASLTDTERTVAGLVAEGLSNQAVANRIFLSRHTVDFHLRHIYRKLGIDSRVVLTRMVVDNIASAR